MPTLELLSVKCTEGKARLADIFEGKNFATARAALCSRSFLDNFCLFVSFLFFFVLLYIIVRFGEFMTQ